ncbi:MAG: hypothetical protein KC777_09685 [Cyanobacteria bacterium HKST-UBA02]|nr:hypothetical protein [Cyanobacteria bacterium HKST-UBA02]
MLKPLSLKSILWTIVLLALIFAIVDFACYPSRVSTRAPSANQGKNGLWLRYLWYFGKKSEKEKESLAARLKDNQIVYAYFHVRSTDAQGRLKFRYRENALALNQFIHDHAPGVRSIAWVYVPSRYGQNGVDLRSSKTRTNLVREADWLINDCGFDGIQWDYEFFPCGEPDFTRLLDETREKLGRDHLISVATPMWYPFTAWGWSDGYFSEVASHCDQIAVMCYDSFYYFPRAYTWLVSQQAVHVTAAVARSASDCRVILGIPVYDGGTAGHISHSENIRTALVGVREGLAEPGAVESVFDGIAPFADYTMDNEEWRIYRESWLENQGFDGGAD